MLQQLCLLLISCVFFITFAAEAKDKKEEDLSAPDFSKYTLPLYFSPGDNGIETTAGEFSYRLNSKDELTLGRTTFAPSDFSITLQGVDTDDKGKPISPRYTFKITWNAFFDNNRLELKTVKEGTVFWHDDGDKGFFEEKLSQSDVEKFALDQAIRFCVTKSNADRTVATYCSPNVAFSKNEQGLVELKSYSAFKKEIKIRERQANKKMVFAKDEAKIALNYQESSSSSTQSVDLPVTDEFMNTVLGKEPTSKEYVLGIGSKMKRKLKIDSASFNKEEASGKISEIGGGTTIRFCAGEDCSPKYKFAKAARSFSIDALSAAESSGPRDPVEMPQDITINDKNEKLEGAKAFQGENPTLSLKAFLKSGGEYNFAIIPPAENVCIKDFVSTRDGKNYIVTGCDAIPIETVNEAKPNSWTATLENNEPMLHFANPDGIPIRYKFKINKRVPKDDLRAFGRYDSRRGSYKNSVPIHGVFKDSHQFKATSTETEAVMTSDQTFDWQFLSDEKGKINDRRLKISGRGDDFIAHYEVYRAYPFDATIRFTGVFTDAKSILYQSELGFSAWLEQFFKSENRLFSVQRWGLNLQYMMGINDAKNSSDNSVKFSTLNGDIRYRIRPGVHRFEETYGAFLGYQSITFQATSGSMIGLGGFWGRPLFKGVDRFLNKLKFLRYPKWVEAEGIYYFLAGNSNTVMGRNFNVHTRLKLQIKPTWYIEGGLGYKYFDFISKTTNLIAQTGVFQGTLGLGYQF